MVDTVSSATPGLLLSRAFLREYGRRLDEAAREAGLRPQVIALPAEPEGRLEPEACARVEIAFFSPDVFPDHSRAFFAALHGADRLRWLHVFNTGVRPGRAPSRSRRPRSPGCWPWREASRTGSRPSAGASGTPARGSRPRPTCAARRS
jgi:hypothetical protein